MLIEPLIRYLHPRLLTMSTNLCHYSNKPKMLTDKLVWIDLEMTGLDIEKDSILEIACCVTDFKFSDIITGPNIAIKTSEQTLLSMDPWCINQHAKSGLTDQCKESSVTLVDAEEAVLNFVKAHVDKGVAPLAGNTVYMDRLFLRKFMPKLDDHMHYRIVDVSSIREVCKRWAPEIAKAAPEKRHRHRAMEDILESINELKYFSVNIFNLAS